jgi:lipoprotein signal peptidase
MRQSTAVTRWLFFVDLLVKYLAVRGNYAVINLGVSFGIKMGSEWLFWALWAIILVWLYQQKMWLILAGGAANLVSRVVWGGVVDYLPFFGLFYNNLADYMIVGGIIIYGYTHIVRR